MQKTILSVFNNMECPKSPPIWLMRQAGRYLPEYKKVRKQAGSFLDLCYSPELACEVTLQPIRKYAFDASILFADILLIPDALGQKVWFVEGEGPRLEPVSSPDTLSLDNLSHHMQPVYKTVSLLKQRLPDDTTLIGFAGSPWTVATYMIAGRGTPDQGPAHALKQNDIIAFQGLLDVIVEATIDYLASQVEHGAEVLQHDALRCGHVVPLRPGHGRGRHRRLGMRKLGGALPDLLRGRPAQPGRWSGLAPRAGTCASDAAVWSG